MTRDIDYFQEKDLDKTNIKDFYQSLPDHLKIKFKASLNSTIEWANVLQGYRGPSKFCNNGSGDSQALEASRGMQEIKYWWAFRKDLNAQIPVVGSLLFGLGRVVQASSGHLAWSSLYFDEITGECLSHDKNEATELLNSRGLQLFDEARYDEAAKYHNNAYQACSSGYCNESTFKKNAKKAENEAKAMNLNSMGDGRFEQGRYSEAVDKYKEACDGTEVVAQYRKYKDNWEKAQVELDARQLNSEGDLLFQQGKRTEAINKNQEAYEKSQVEREKSVYNSNREKVEMIVDKLLSLRNLWERAWDAENDVTTDRSEVAREIFERILSECQLSLIIFPNEVKLKQYEALVTLKIQGNEVFNDGLESQKNGIQLFREAQELKIQEKYELANVKLNEAKMKFLQAQRKYRLGSESDERFVSCIGFIQEQIDEVTRTMEIIEECILSGGLNRLETDESCDAVSDQPVSSNEAGIYFQQI